jgi:hypothetical protein
MEAAASSRATERNVAPAFTSNVYGDTGNGNGRSSHQPAIPAPSNTTNTSAAAARATNLTMGNIVDPEPTQPNAP